jgi:O-antigen/teichoic acid export membrane protein
MLDNMSSVKRSIFYSAVEKYGSMFFFLISTAILSRLLTPEEFGIFAIVSALTAIVAASFQEFGGANYLIQKDSLSERDIRTAFTVTFFLSILIGLVLYAGRNLFAGFFGKEDLQEGIAVSALNFAVWPIFITVSALFRREMKFGILAICNLVGNFLTSLVSIVLAIFHYSYMAPIWGALVGNVVIVILLIVWRKDLRIFIPSFTGYLDVIRFGLYSSGVVVINIFYNMAPQLILARVLDFTAVGLYSRAGAVTQVFDKVVTQVLSPIIMPAIFAHSKAGGELKTIYLDAIELLTSVHWPFLSFVAIMAHPIIFIWLGPTWVEIIPLVRMLALAYLALFAACLSYPILVAVGSVRDALVSSLISLPPSLIIILIASFFGIEAVAASALLTLPFQAFVTIYFISRHLLMKPRELMIATLKSAIVTLCSSAGAIVSITIIHAGLMGPFSGLFLAMILAISGWLFGLMITAHPLLAHLRSAAHLDSGFPKFPTVGPGRIRSNERSY